jgi:class 3 adenylate cyclase/tetratricopeptide (TPR) repeat protein
MHDQDIDALRAAIAALEGQRATLGDAVVELAVAPLRERLAGLQRPAGLQRRQVTVLFADVVGSTAITQALDAEDALDVLSGALQRMADIVEAHQGRVLRFTGDGLKAAFGMAEAREDDAEHAVRAGLAMLDAGREHAAEVLRLHGVADFAVRVGVHTGSVTLGAGVEADNTAMGAAVHIAARMEQSAPPGGLRISHDTWNQVRGLFEAEAQAPLPLKGIDTPMQTHLVRGALARGFAGVERGLQGLSTPLVGRQVELARLQALVTQARQSRSAQAITLVGDAGLGKSRLLRELVSGLPSEAGCRLLASRSQPDSLLRPWGLLRDWLAAQFGIADTDPAETARRKVEDGLAPWFAERGQAQAQLIGQLSGLDFGTSPHVRGLDPRALRDQALAAFCGYLQALAAQGTSLPLLIVEDLHWADDGSLDLLQHLLAHAAELPLALIMTCRPTLLSRRPDWGSTHPLLQMGPLGAAQSGQLAQALLQRLDQAPARLTELIVGQAEGNPYYMEELVRRLVDDGVIVVDGPQWTVRAERLQELRLPGTLVGLLQARLDALPPADRLAARQASVIGHVFWDEALAALDAKAPQALPALQRWAFVRAHAGSDFEGTVERQFDHHLLHQVTYDTLVRAERRHGHGAVARWLAARTRGRGAEFLAMTGDHAERAGETALAIDCFDQAANEARKRFANSAAEDWLRRALGLLGESDPARRFELLARLNNLADTVGDRDRQDAVQQEMAALLDRHPDDARRARCLVAQALLADRRTDTAASEQLALQAVALAERCGATESAAMAQGQLCWLHIARSDMEGARRHADAALHWAGRIEIEADRVENEAKLLVLSAMVLMATDQFDAALQALLSVLSRSEALGSTRLSLSALDNLAVTTAMLGQWDESIGWAERMHELAQSSGARPRLAHALHHRAVARQALGKHAEAMDLFRQVVAIAHANGDRRVEGPSLQSLGISMFELGDAGAALQLHTQAHEIFEAMQDPLDACTSAAHQALCQTRLGQTDAALLRVNPLLDRLGSEFATCAFKDTLDLRWSCQRVLAAAGDARAATLLAELVADAHAHTARRTHAADRARLMQALPTLRGILAAQASGGEPAAAG